MRACVYLILDLTYVIFDLTYKILYVFTCVYFRPNVCEFLEEDEEGSEVNTKFNSSGIFFHTSSKFSSCKDEPDRYVCTTM